MSDDKQSWLNRMFHHDTATKDQPASQASPTPPGRLSGDSTVSEWLNHPVGGAIFRDMLAQAGQKESVLRPVHRLPLKRLVAMSKGRFTEEAMNDMIQKANTGQAPDVTTDSSNSAVEAAPPAIARPAWQEKITADRFTGKTIIVTGAGSGIGRATASRIAREGGRVIAVDISKERLDEFSASLGEAHIVTVAGDISSDETITAIVKAAGETIDGLANVAGIMDNMTPLHEVSDEIWDRVMAVNLTGLMKLTRAVLPTMLAQQTGTIVNVASEASLRGSAAGVAYTTSKHAVIGLTKSTAFMYGPSGIRTNAVAPGAVLTNIEARFDSELGSERVNALLGTIPDAAEADMLAASICFLLSDDSININGAIVPSDGGWSVQ